MTDDVGKAKGYPFADLFKGGLNLCTQCSRQDVFLIA
jgi:hypothetical protein